MAETALANMSTNTSPPYRRAGGRVTGSAAGLPAGRGAAGPAGCGGRRHRGADKLTR